MSNIKNKKLTALLMCLYMFERCESSEYFGKFFSRSSPEKENLLNKGNYYNSSSSSNNSKSVISLKLLLGISALVVIVTAFTNFFTDYEHKNIIGDAFTIHCPESPFAINTTKTTTNCGMFTCNLSPNVMTSNCFSEDNICTTNPNTTTASCPSCTTDSSIMTTNCDSVSTYECNNSTTITTNNCGTLTPVVCNTGATTTNQACSYVTCNSNVTQMTSNCASANYIKNPNKNTTGCSNTQNICNINSSATSSNCPNADIIVDPIECVRSAGGICITSDNGAVCGNVPPVTTVPISTITKTKADDPCLSYTSIAKDRPLASYHACTTTIGATDNAVTCGDCFENATPFQQATNPFGECSGFATVESVIYMQYDDEKSNNSLIGTCNTGATGTITTCDDCYGYSSVTQAELTNNVLPECAIIPYDSKKSSVTITAGECTIPVPDATTCMGCYAFADLSEQVLNALSNCGITPYDSTKSSVTITAGTCTTSLTDASQATTCGACYSTASKTEQTLGVLNACGKPPLINDIKLANPSYVEYVPQYENPTPVITNNTIACSECPSSNALWEDGWVYNLPTVCKTPTTATCSAYTPYRANTSLSGECPFNFWARTCADCYLQPNVTDFQRSYDVISECNWDSGGWTIDCASCPIYKYSNLTSVWDPVCTQNIVKCSDCDNWEDEPECVIRESISCSQCGSCANSLDPSDVPVECLTPSSIPCTTCTDTLKQDRSDVFSKQCAYKTPISCINCADCSAGIDIPTECQTTPSSFFCSECDSCTSITECQTKQSITCNECCGTSSGVTSTTPAECQIKTSVACSSCNSCTSGSNIPSECASNITSICTNCQACKSGTFIPSECAVKPTIACGACASCTNGTNIPTECQVNKTVSCGSCSTASSLPECLSNTVHVSTECNKCPSANLLNDCMEEHNSQEIGGFIGNVALGLIGGGNALYLVQNQKIVSGVYAVASLTIGVLMLIGIHENIHGLASISGNTALTLSGNILGSANIFAGVLNLITIAVMQKIK
jgi:hypothetical protein